MKKFLTVLSVFCAFILEGCSMCGGATPMNVYSPWGRSNVLEISTYTIQAEKPTDSELSSGFSLDYFIVGEGTFVTKITQDADKNLVIENTYSFRGQYFTAKNPNTPITALEDSKGTWLENGFFEDEYTSKVVISGLSKNNMNAKESTKTATFTAPAFMDDTWFLRKAQYTQTITYGETEAVAKVENADLAATGLTEDEIITMHCGSDTDFEWTYSYGSNDLVYDNESFLAVLRAYSVNNDFAKGEGAVTPTSFRVINPRTRNLVNMRFSVTETNYTRTPFNSDLACQDIDNPNYTQKTVDEAAIYKVSLGLTSGYTGSPADYYILKDDSVKYLSSEGSVSEPISINRVIRIEDDMHMTYSLKSYINSSDKSIS